MNTKKVLLLPKYSQQAASYRYRYGQYLPLLKECGLEVTSQSLIDDDLYISRIWQKNFSLTRTLSAYWKRLKFLIRKGDFDVIVIHLEALPYIPQWLEQTLLRGDTPYFLDYDDAIFHQYDRNKNPLVRFLMKTKIPKIAAGASGVFAGSPYLIEFLSRYNNNVIYLPTVVDIEAYAPAKRELNSPPIVGWMGSPSTSLYLENVKGPLSRYHEKYNRRLIAVGAGDRTLEGLDWENRPWSLENEVSNLKAFDVGIMPLNNTLWEKGKCGFKLIQYMACGLPTIGSPVGVNTEIIKHGETGFLAESEKDWDDALEFYASHPKETKEMGLQGYERAKSHYSLEVTFPKLFDAITNV